MQCKDAMRFSKHDMCPVYFAGTLIDTCLYNPTSSLSPPDPFASHYPLPSRIKELPYPTATMMAEPDVSKPNRDTMQLSAINEEERPTINSKTASYDQIEVEDQEQGHGEVRKRKIGAA